MVNATPMNMIASELPSWTDAFLDMLEETGLINTAAAAVRTTARKIATLREQSVEFDEAVERALQLSHDKLEAEARRRAVDGIEKGVYYQGTLVDTERQYSDSLLTTLLKAKRPDEFAERKQITGAGGGPLTVVVRTFGPPPSGSPADPLPIIDAQFTPVGSPANVSLEDVLSMV